MEIPLYIIFVDKDIWCSNVRCWRPQITEVASLWCRRRRERDGRGNRRRVRCEEAYVGGLRPSVESHCRLYATPPYMQKFVFVPTPALQSKCRQFSSFSTLLLMGFGYVDVGRVSARRRRLWRYRADDWVGNGDNGCAAKRFANQLVAFYAFFELLHKN